MRFDPRALQRLRKRRGWTIAQAAEKIGVSRQSISYFESGAVRPSAKTLGLMADVFRVPVGRFYTKNGGDDAREDS